jgi:hypothetical protein
MCIMERCIYCWNMFVHLCFFFVYRSYVSNESFCSQSSSLVTKPRSRRNLRRQSGTAARKNLIVRSDLYLRATQWVPPTLYTYILFIRNINFAMCHRRCMLFARLTDVQRARQQYIQSPPWRLWADLECAVIDDESHIEGRAGEAASGLPATAKQARAGGGVSSLAPVSYVCRGVFVVLPPAALFKSNSQQASVKTHPQNGPSYSSL